VEDEFPLKTSYFQGPTVNLPEGITEQWLLNHCWLMKHVWGLKRYINILLIWIM
jgi:hypothetical protein